MKKIALIGMMGCGKTTVGKALAESLQLEFVDIDKEIEIAENMTISEIFAQKGELFFRKIEKNILQKFAGGRIVVLSHFLTLHKLKSTALKF